MLRFLEKLLGLLAIIPPLYIFIRFVRWSLKQEVATKEEQESS